MYLEIQSQYHAKTNTVEEEIAELKAALSVLPRLRKQKQGKANNEGDEEDQEDAEEEDGENDDAEAEPAAKKSKDCVIIISTDAHSNYTRIFRFAQ